MRTRKIKFMAACFVLFLSTAVQAQTGGDFTITQSVIASGGGQNVGNLFARRHYRAIARRSEFKRQHIRFVRRLLDGAQTGIGVLKSRQRIVARFPGSIVCN